jgi:hypothetical protein
MDNSFVDRENVFGKLSRIFETHTYRNDGTRPERDEDELLEGIMCEFESLDGDQPVLNSPRETRGGKMTGKSPGANSMMDLSFNNNNNNNRPTPFDVWSSRQKDSSKGVKPVYYLYKLFDYHFIITLRPPEYSDQTILLGSALKWPAVGSTG